MIRTETFEDRVLLTQTVTPAPVDQAVGVDSDVSFAVNYTTDDDTLTGLVLRVHFDSSQFSFNGDPARSANGDVTDPADIPVFGADGLVTDTFALNFNTAQVLSDASDLDGDASTDMFLNILWADTGGFWPRGSTGIPPAPNPDPIAQPVKLFDFNLTTDSDFETSGPTTVRFTGEPAAGETFASTPHVISFQQGPPTVSIANAADVTEGGSATFDVSLSRALVAGETATVDFTTTDGTAVSPGDFAVTTGTLTFAAGESTKTITVNTVNDTVPEAAEAFSVTLSNSTFATLGTATGQATINDDGDQPVVSLSADQTVEEGGTLSYVVTLDASPLTAVTVDIATTDDTALAASDYTAVTRTLTFAAGATGAALTQTVTVDTTEDDVVESVETFGIALSNIVGATGSGTATGTITDDDGNGSISGIKFHDRNLNGVQDAGEEGLEGWVITLTDTATDVALTQTTGADGTYSFETVPAGTYTVTETQQTGFRQSAPATANEQAAYDLDQSLNLFSSGNEFENWGGLGEKWVQGDGGWYYITPDGGVFEWAGSPRTNLTGTFVAQLDSSFHTDLATLYDAAEPNGHSITLAANQQLTDIDFGNYQLGTISGSKFLDANENGAFDTGEELLSGWTIQLVDANGTILNSAVTDVDGNYSFTDVEPGEYFIREVPQDGFVQTFPEVDPNAVLAEEAFYLDQDRGFVATANDFQDWGGRDEKWFQSTTGYHFVTPNGNVYDWDGSARSALTGMLVGSLDSSYYDDLALITDAQFPGGTTITVGSGDSITQLFGNAEVTGIADGDYGVGNVSASVSNGDLIITGDDYANGVAVFLDESGSIVVVGTGQTTINGSDDVFVAFESSNAVPDDLRINLNGNHNLLALEGFDVNDDLRIITGDGDDYVVINNVNVYDDLYIDTNFGSDIVAISESLVADLTTIYTDNGHDVVAVIDSVHMNDVRVDLAEGHNSLYVDGSQFGDDVRVNMESGNDKVALIDSVVTDNAQLDGGSGTDALLNDNSTAGSVDAVSFEEDTIASLNADIDEVLTRLADRGIDFSFDD